MTAVTFCLFYFSFSFGDVKGGWFFPIVLKKGNLKIIHLTSFV